MWLTSGQVCNIEKNISSRNHVAMLFMCTNCVDTDSDIDMNMYLDAQYAIIMAGHSQQPPTFNAVKGQIYSYGFLNS